MWSDGTLVDYINWAPGELAVTCVQCQEVIKFCLTLLQILQMQLIAIIQVSLRSKQL